MKLQIRQWEWCIFVGYCFIGILLGLLVDTSHWRLPEWSVWCRNSYDKCDGNMDQFNIYYPSGNAVLVYMVSRWSAANVHCATNVDWLCSRYLLINLDSIVISITKLRPSWHLSTNGGRFCVLLLSLWTLNLRSMSNCVKSWRGTFLKNVSGYQVQFIHEIGSKIGTTNTRFIS